MNASRSHAFVEQLTLFSILLIFTSGSIGMGTVWLRHQISVTANAIKKQESSIDELQRRIADTTTTIEIEQSPDVLRRRNDQFHLGLVMPKEFMVKRVSLDPELLLATKRNRGIFSSDSPVVVVFRPDTGAFR